MVLHGTKFKLQINNTWFIARFCIPPVTNEQGIFFARTIRFLKRKGGGYKRRRKEEMSLLSARERRGKSIYHPTHTKKIDLV